MDKLALVLGLLIVAGITVTNETEHSKPASHADTEIQHAELRRNKVEVDHVEWAPDSKRLHLRVEQI